MLFKQKLSFYPFAPSLIRVYASENGAKPDDAPRNLLKGTNNLESNNMTFFDTILPAAMLIQGIRMKPSAFCEYFKNATFFIPRLFLAGSCITQNPITFSAKRTRKRATGNRPSQTTRLSQPLEGRRQNAPEIAEAQGLLKELKKRNR